MIKFPASLNFKDLQTRDGLLDLDQRFLAFLQSTSPDLFSDLRSARDNPDTLPSLEESKLILSLAPFVEDFFASIFEIEKSVQALQERHFDLAPLFTCKRLFIQRKVAHGYTPQSVKVFQDPETLFKDFLVLEDLVFCKKNS